MTPHRHTVAEANTAPVAPLPLDYAPARGGRWRRLARLELRTWVTVLVAVAACAGFWRHRHSWVVERNEPSRVPWPADAFATNGRDIVLPGTGPAANKALEIRTLDGWRLRRTIPLDRPLENLGITPDGRRVFAGLSPKVLAIWSTDDGGEIARHPRDGGADQRAYLTDNGQAITFVHDTTARVVDMETGQPRFPALRLGIGAVQSTWSRDGRFRLESDNIGVRVWDLQTGKVVESAEPFTLSPAEKKEALLQQSRFGFWRL